MGTETVEFLREYNIEDVAEVKLNNPQMGTETHNVCTAIVPCRKVVKLNNPQMGTETYGPHYSCFYTEHLYS